MEKDEKVMLIAALHCQWAYLLVAAALSFTHT
jgi:hypothetical protein